MKKVVTIVLAAALLLGVCAPSWAAQPVMNRNQYRKNLIYNKNALPIAWKYEAGYTLWRMQRKLAANPSTYRKYKNDKAWHRRMHRNYRPEELLLNTFDWTVDEAAFFLMKNQDYFKFHPAGYAD